MSDLAIARLLVTALAVALLACGGFLLHPASPRLVGKLPRAYAVGVVLSAENKKQFYIPEGFAHGFVTLTPNVNVAYKVDGYYEPQADRGIAFDDPDLAIDWPMPVEHLILSEKDQHHPQLKDAEINFSYQG